MTYQALIVDDEPLGRERIRQLLANEPDFHVVGECANGAEAVTAISKDQPDVVFLDIQMPGLDGFGVLHALQEAHVVLPSIIFVTAFDRHAVQAFEVHALDYLLKPVERERFQQALKRIRDNRQQAGPAIPEGFMRWLETQARPSTYLSRLEVRNHDRWEYIPVGQVMSLEADGNYIEVHTDERSHLIRTTMAELEDKLNPADFLRIGRSTIVNLSAVASIKREGRNDFLAVMKNGRRLPIARGIGTLQQRMQFS